MRVQFVKEHQRAGEARPRRVGELADLPDDEAFKLVAADIAKPHELGPTETKREGAAEDDDVPLLRGDSEEDDGGAPV